MLTAHIDYQEPSSNHIRMVNGKSSITNASVSHTSLVLL